MTDGISRIYPVIMCGGAGTRLWPVSTARVPKQFRSLLADRSIFQDTVLRVQPDRLPAAHARPLIVSNAAYRAQVEDQLAALGIAPLAILLEPAGRNTAAVAAAASDYIHKLDPDGLVLLLPSDHHVADPEIFCAAASASATLSASGRIVTFGIAPARPDTGFGYIQSGDRLAANLFAVAKFHEKPDAALAETYLRDPRYSWNAGIFLFPAALMIDELATHAPRVLALAREALAAAQIDGDAVHLEPASFGTIEPISIDRAVMEKTHRAAVYAPLACGWSDIGTWPMIGELEPIRTQTAPVLIDVAGCVIHAQDDTLIAAIGVEGLVIVAANGCVLVMPKSRAQDTGKIVAALAARGALDRI